MSEALWWSQGVPLKSAACVPRLPHTRTQVVILAEDGRCDGLAAEHTRVPCLNDRIH